MFGKVMIAEDHESSNFSVQKVLQDLNISSVEYFYYCDDAFSNFKKSLNNENPFDLLITDLNFEEDHRKQMIKDGKELIKSCRSIDPGLKVIVFSAEHKIGIIDMLFQQLKINAFVRKARSDSKELKKAVEHVYNGDKYISHDLKLPVKAMNTLEFSNFDIILLKLLSEGILQKNIPPVLQTKNISPNSLSSIEKKINGMKILLKVTNNEQLIAKCKDLGII